MRLGLAAIIRDRAPWVREWLAFHSLVGFSNFYIYVHRCQDDTAEICQRLARHLDLKVIMVPEDTDRPQYVAYNRAYEDFGNDVDWLAFIDGDEFLFAPGDTDVKHALELFASKKLSALGVYWACFGSSGHVREPDGLIIENYRHRGANNMPANKHIKSIVMGRQGASVKCVDDPHMFVTPLGTFDERGRKILGGRTIYYPSYEHLRINHYATQSREYFERHKRGMGMATHQAKADRERPQSWWVEYDRNDVLDDSMARFVEPVKQLLKAWD